MIDHTDSKPYHPIEAALPDRAAMPRTFGKKMKRSNTVRASLLILSVWIVGVITGLIPENIDEDSGIWQIVRFLPIAAGVRLFILFWQTLIDAVECKSVGWVVGHFLFGPFSSIPYYLVTKERPPEPDPTPPFEHFSRRLPEEYEAEQDEDPMPDSAPS